MVRESQDVLDLYSIVEPVNVFATGWYGGKTGNIKRMENLFLLAQYQEYQSSFSLILCTYKLNKTSPT